MNAVLEVMQNCEAFGVKISVSGEKLKIDAPKGLPDSIKESLRQHKADIIRKLARDGETVNAPSLTAKISRMISEGVKFDISAADFQAFGNFDKTKTA